MVVEAYHSPLYLHIQPLLSMLLFGATLNYLYHMPYCSEESPWLGAYEP